MNYWGFINFFRDWRDAVFALFEVWFLTYNQIERRLIFLDNGVDEKRKKRLPYKIIKFIYNFKLQ